MSADRGIKEERGAAVRLWTAWLIAGLLLLALVPSVARFVTTSAGWLPYPYPRAGSEGLILYESLLVKRGGDIYAPITPEQFISGPYPPIYYWVASWLLPHSLPDFSTPDAVSSIFTPGRVVSLLAALIIAGLIPLLVLLEFQVQGSRFKVPRSQTDQTAPGDWDSGGRARHALWLTLAGGTIGGLIFLTLPQAMVWATRFRGDMLMLAFTAAGLVCVAAGSRIDDRRRTTDDQRTDTQHPTPDTLSIVALILGAIFFALAFYTKQTAIAGPVAAAAYLLLRDWRLGLKWCGVMLLAVGIPFIILEVATGHWFYLKMVDYHSLPLRGSTLTRLLEFAFWEDSWPLIVVALGYALYRFVGWARVLRSPEMRAARSGPLLIPIFLTASLLTLPTGAVVGADHNHLLMSGLAIAASVGAACALGLLAGAGYQGSGAGGKEPTDTRHPSPVTLLVVAALVLIYALATSQPSSWYEADLAVPGEAEQEQYRLIVQNTRDNPGTLFFADDPGILALAGKETLFDDPFTMTALAEGGRWDESAYRQMLREGRFALLVLQCNVIEAPEGCRYDTLTPGVADSIREGYRVLFRDVLFTYVPK